MKAVILSILIIILLLISKKNKETFANYIWSMNQSIISYEIY